jgi:hypothetical protein
MAYLGNTPTQQGFIPAIDFFSGNGATVAFTLSRPVASVAQVQATIENVPQNPGTAFTVSGNTITFDGAPPSGTNNIYVYYTSPITQVIAPSQGTVFPSTLSTGGPFWDTSGNLGVGTSSPATYNGKLVVKTSDQAVLGYFGGTTYASRHGANSSFATIEGVDAATGVSSYQPLQIGGSILSMATGGTERMRIDASGRVTTPSQPAFRASIATSFVLTPTVQRLSGSGFLTERFDIGNNFDPNTSRFTAPVAGIYIFGMYWAPPSTGRMNSFFYVNNSQTAILSSANGGASFTAILSLAAGDYVEPWVQSATGGSITLDNSGEIFGYLLG